MTHQKILTMLAGCDSQKPMTFDDLVRKSGLLPGTLKQVLDQLANGAPPTINRATIIREGLTQMMIWPTGVVVHRTGPQGIVINQAKHIQQQLTETMRKPATNMQPSVAKVKQTASIMQATEEKPMSKTTKPAAGNQPSELNKTIYDKIVAQPGITLWALLRHAVQQVPGATETKANKTLQNMVYVTKKVRAEGERGAKTYFASEVAAKPAAATPIIKTKKPQAEKPAKSSTCPKSQVQGDQAFIIMFSDDNMLNISIDGFTLSLDQAQTVRLHRFIGRINMGGAPA